MASSGGGADAAGVAALLAANAPTRHAGPTGDPEVDALLTRYTGSA